MGREDGVPLLLVRHCEQERVPRDGPLTERGRRQAQALVDTLALTSDDVVVASPMLRARQTAHAFGHVFWVVDELGEYRAGEPLPGFQDRVQAALRRLFEREIAGRLVVCTHGGVVDAALRFAFGIPVDWPWSAEAALAHGSVTELRYWPAESYAVLVRVGDVAHLAPELVSGRVPRWRVGGADGPAHPDP